MHSFYPGATSLPHLIRSFGKGNTDTFKTCARKFYYKLSTKVYRDRRHEKWDDLNLNIISCMIKHERHSFFLRTAFFLSSLFAWLKNRSQYQIWLCSYFEEEWYSLWYKQIATIFRLDPQATSPLQQFLFITVNIC